MGERGDQLSVISYQLSERHKTQDCKTQEKRKRREEIRQEKHE
jgi:hypothetical protein